jgi:alkylation response protein AidB-like acyl-CoA dehydrogenase
MARPARLADGFMNANPACLDYPVGRILRDARLYTVGAGTQEIRRMLIGREFNEELLGHRTQ